MFFLIYSTFSLFSNVQGFNENVWTIGETDEIVHHKLGPENLPGIWDSFPKYWDKVCSEKVEENQFKHWNKPWFLKTMIELSIEKGGNDYGKILGSNCCITTGMNYHGEGGFNVQLLPGYVSNSYRVYALCKPTTELRKKIVALNPNKKISKHVHVPIIQYYWSMKGLSAATFDGKCELRTGCSSRDSLDGEFEAKKLFGLLHLDNVHKLAGGINDQGAQELLGCMKYIEDRKTYSCPVE